MHRIIVATILALSFASGASAEDAVTFKQMSKLPPGSTRIAEDSAGRVYFAVAGTDGGLYVHRKGRLERLVEGDAGDVAVAANGAVWYTLRKKVFTFPAGKASETVERTEAFGGPAGGARHVFAGRLGEVWVEGCPKRRKADGKFSAVPRCPLPGPSPAPAAAGQCGNLWGLLHGARGAKARPVALTAPLNVRWTVFGKGDGLGPERIDHVVCDLVGYAWAGGAGGVWRFDPRAPQAGWVALPGDALAGGHVTAMAPGPRGRVVVAIEAAPGKAKGKRTPTGSPAASGLFELDLLADGTAVARALAVAGLEKLTIRALRWDAAGRCWAVAANGAVLAAEAPADAWQRRWRPLAPMPYGNHDIFAAVLNARMYIAGGMANHGFPAKYVYFDRMYVYDAAAGRWSVTSEMDFGRCYAGVAAVGDKIWVVGGGVDVSSKGEHKRRAVPWIAIYDPATDTWTEGPDLDRPRMESIVKYVNGRLWVLGGYSSGASDVSCVSRAVGEDAWRAEPNAPFGVRQCSSAQLDGVVYVQTMSNGLIAFNTKTRRWETNFPAPPEVKKVGPRAVLITAYKGELWLIGGLDTSEPTAVRIFNPKTRSWRMGPSVPHPMAWGPAAVVGGKLIIAGGAYYSKPHKYFIFTDTAYELREH